MRALVGLRDLGTGDSKPALYAQVTPDQERAILKMAGEGVKLAKVARITGLSRPTIYRVLRNQEPERRDHEQMVG